MICNQVVTDAPWCPSIVMRFKILLTLLCLSVVVILKWNPRSGLESSENVGIQVETTGEGPSLVEVPLVIEGANPNLTATRISTLDPSLQPDTIWANGKVDYPNGISPAPDTRVWGRGAKWPGGSHWYGAKVASDGSFKMAFAQGTEAGSLFLQDPECWSMRTSFRVWQKGPIEVIGQRGSPQRIQVVGEDLDLGELGYALSMGSAEGMPLIGEGAHRYRFATPSGRQRRVVVEDTDFPVIPLIIGGAEEDLSTDSILTISKPARVEGQLIGVDGQTLEYPWIQVGLLKAPLVKREDGGVPATALNLVVDILPLELNKIVDSDGAFSVEVPPGHAIRLVVHARDHKWNEVISPVLSAGETFRFPDINLSAGKPKRFGRLVDPAGRPIANAWIRAGSDMNAAGVFLQDPGRGVQHEHLTDSNGEFRLPSHNPWDFSSQTIRAFVTPGLEKPSPIARECHASTVIQTFELGEQDRQTFVLDPQPGGLHGTVRGQDGAPIQRFVITCRSSPEPNSGWGGGCVTSITSPSPYLPDGVERGQWREHPRYHPSFEIEWSSNEGAFDWRTLPKGTWDLRVSAEGFVSSVFLRVAVPNAEPLVASLEESGGALVQARDFAGNARPDVWVRILPSPFYPTSFFGGTPKDQAKTDPEGYARFSGLPAGSYEVELAGKGAFAKCEQSFEVVAGEISNVVLQSKPRGEVILETSWPDSSLRVSPRLTSVDNNRTYHFQDSKLCKPFHLRDVEPGRYQLSFGLPNKLAEPTIQVRAGSITRVPIQLKDGVNHVQGTVAVNDIPTGYGKLCLRYSNSITPKEEVRISSAGRFAALLPAVPIERIQIEVQHRRLEVQDWNQPSEGQLWRVNATAMEVVLSLHESNAQAVHMSNNTGGYNYLRHSSKSLLRAGTLKGQSLSFSWLVPGEYELKLQRPKTEFPWVLCKPASIQVTPEHPVQEWSVEVKPALPVSCEITSTNWPSEKAAWLMAWRHPEGKGVLGKKRFNPNQDRLVELYGPESRRFWLSVEAKRNEHGPNTVIHGPFKTSESNGTPIRIPAYFTE